MRAITDADDPNLTRYLVQEGGKLLIYHGWADTIIPAEPIVDYYDEVLDTTYGGDRAAADDAVRLFMIPRHGALRGRTRAEPVGPAGAHGGLGGKRHGAGFHDG